MPKRRGNKEGSIYRRKDDGRWIGGVTIDGKRMSKSFKTRKDAQAWVKETTTQIEDGLTVQGAQTTLESYLKQWLETARPTIRPKTWEQYSQIINQHVIPDLGSVRLNDLRPDHVQALYTGKLNSGASSRTVRLIHAVLHRAFGQALKWGLVRRNVCDAVDKPQKKRTEMKALDVGQAQALLRAAEGHRWEALYHLAISTGLRQGELLGLRWSDLDWDSGRLRVQRQLQRVTGEGVTYPEPKTAAGRRSIVLGPLDLAKLRAHKKQQVQERLLAGGNWVVNDQIFTSLIGTPADGSQVLKQLKKLLAVADLPDIRFHDLRHTAATIMLTQNVHPKVVQERLGHSSIELTLNTYSHVLPSMQEDAAHLMNAILGAK